MKLIQRTTMYNLVLPRPPPPPPRPPRIPAARQSTTCQTHLQWHTGSTNICYNLYCPIHILSSDISATQYNLRLFIGTSLLPLYQTSVNETAMEEVVTSTHATAAALTLLLEVFLRQCLLHLTTVPLDCVVLHHYNTNTYLSRPHQWHL